MNQTVFSKIAALLTACTLLFTAAPATVSASSLADANADANYALLQEIIDLYIDTSLYETDRESLIDNMIYRYLASDPMAFASLANALLGSYDPYSAYYKAESGFLSNTTKSLGVMVSDSDSFDDGIERTGGVYITEVLPESNAEFAGILAGDRFVSIEGINVEGLSVSAIQYLLKLMPLVDKDPNASKLFADAAEQKLDRETLEQFTLLDWDPAKEISIGFERTLSDGSRADITVSLPRGTTKAKNITHSYDKETKIGVIAISSFGEVSMREEFFRAFDDLRDKGAQKLIIDLRDNAGGYFEAAKELGSYFYDGEQVMFYTRARGEEPIAALSAGNYVGDTFEEYAVLINENTASAAELFAYMLQSGVNAALIGEVSYGKAVGQDAYTITNGDRFTITAFEILRADLSSYNEIGLTPDVTIALTREKYEFPTGLAYFNHENYVEIVEGAQNDPTLALEQRLHMLGLLRSEAVEGLCDSATRAATYLYRVLYMNEDKKTANGDVTFDMVTAMTATINGYKERYVYFDSQSNVAELWLENHSRGKRLAKEYTTAEEKLIAAEEQKRSEQQEANRREYEEQMRAEAEANGRADRDED